MLLELFEIPVFFLYGPFEVFVEAQYHSALFIDKAPELSVLSRNRLFVLNYLPRILHSAARRLGTIPERGNPDFVEARYIS